jgi:hypothetical protein
MPEYAKRIEEIVDLGDAIEYLIGVCKNPFEEEESKNVSKTFFEEKDIGARFKKRKEKKSFI